ncbi:MAG: Gfo/Idh/MocA family protein, partial [Chitinophagaceae bacterium]
MSSSRRIFIKQSAKASAALYSASLGFSAKSYARIIGANDRVNVGVVGFSDRFRSSLLPAFLDHQKELNFDIVAVSDIWRIRREEGQAVLKSKLDHEVKACINNDELYRVKELDAVIISTADFQHALHAMEAVKEGKDAYCEKPFAETMEDNRAAFK